MKLSITITFIAAVGSAAAQGSSFKLPKCAKSCLTVAASCDDTASFCSSSCFGPCLTNGCSDAYEQQQLIRACRNPFDEAVSASNSQTATTTQKPKPRPSTSPETETRTSTRTPKEPEPTLLDDESDAKEEEEEKLAEQRAKAIAIANANRTATANSTFPGNSSSTNGTAGEDEDASGAAAPGLTRSLTLCGVAALAGLVVLFA